MAEEYDYLFKSIVVGDGGVGKTALTLRFSKGFFTEDYKMTIGVDFHVKTINIDAVEGPIRAKLQIWDTGGQERFSSIRPMYYRGSLGALLIFDLTNSASFEHLPQWIEEVRANVKTEIPLLLVGNKSDLIDQRAVSLEELNSFTSNFNLYYMETSAKTGEGVGDCFYILACLMIGSGVPDQLTSNGIVFTPGQIPIASSQTFDSYGPQVESEIDYAAPPVPEPTSTEIHETSPTFEPEPVFEYEAPPVPEPSIYENYEPTPSYEPEIPIPEPQVEEAVDQPAEFIFKTPEEILSNEDHEDVELIPDGEPVIEEIYKPKAAPFTSNVPIPAPAPKEFQTPQEIQSTEIEASRSTPFLMQQESVDLQTGDTKETSFEPVYSKKDKKKFEKQKKKDEKEKKLKEDKERQEKLIEEMKESKKEKKEKTKKEKKEKEPRASHEIVSSTQDFSKAEAPSPTSLFQTLSQKTEEPEKSNLASFVPFSEGEESKPQESSSLRIIPNVGDSESMARTSTPSQSSFPISSGTSKTAGIETITCKKCGSILSSDYMFCNKCGSKL